MVHELGNHTQPTALAPGVFFYHHIAKTAGTSWSVDIAKVGGLSHCGTAHLVGPDSIDRLGRSINFSVRNGRLGESISSVEPAGRRQRRTPTSSQLHRQLLDQVRVTWIGDHVYVLVVEVRLRCW